MTRSIIAALAASLAVAGSAFAATTATVTTDLNLRSGPSTNSEVLTTIPNTAEVALDSCVEGRSWCRVTYDGTTGFASSNYLTASMNGETVVVGDNLGPLGIAVNAVGGAVDTVTDAAGTLIRGTADAVADVIDPPEDRIAYVRENRVEPVYFRNEVRVGDGLPESVALNDVPGYEYDYAYVNGQGVFVEPSSRRVVYVVR